MKFQDDISNMNTYIGTYIHTYIRTSRNQYVPYFFKVGGINMGDPITDRADKPASLKSSRYPYKTMDVFLTCGQPEGSNFDRNSFRDSL